MRTTYTLIISLFEAKLVRGANILKKEHGGRVFLTLTVLVRSHYFYYYYSYYYLLYYYYY